MVDQLKFKKFSLCAICKEKNTHTTIGQVNEDYKNYLNIACPDCLIENEKKFPNTQQEILLKHCLHLFDINQSEYEKKQKECMGHCYKQKLNTIEFEENQRVKFQDIVQFTLYLFNQISGLANYIYNIQQNTEKIIKHNQEELLAQYAKSSSSVNSNRIANLKQMTSNRNSSLDFEVESESSTSKHRNNHLNNLKNSLIKRCNYDFETGIEMEQDLTPKEPQLSLIEQKENNFQASNQQQTAQMNKNNRVQTMPNSRNSSKLSNTIENGINKFSDIEKLEESQILNEEKVPQLNFVVCNPINQRNNNTTKVLTYQQSVAKVKQNLTQKHLNKGSSINCNVNHIQTEPCQIQQQEKLNIHNTSFTSNKDYRESQNTTVSSSPANHILSVNSTINKTVNETIQNRKRHFLIEANRTQDQNYHQQRAQSIDVGYQKNFCYQDLKQRSQSIDQSLNLNNNQPTLKIYSNNTESSDCNLTDNSEQDGRKKKLPIKSTTYYPDQQKQQQIIQQTHQNIDLSIINIYDQQNKLIETQKLYQQQQINNNILSSNQEKQIVKALMIKEFGIDCNKGLHIGNLGQLNEPKYIINASWWREWLSYVNFANNISDNSARKMNQRPAQVNNAPLIDEKQTMHELALMDNIKLKDNLLEHYDFEALSQQIFTFIKAWYGIDYEIVRQLKYDPSQSQKQCFALQLDLYPEMQQQNVIPICLRQRKTKKQQSKLHQRLLQNDIQINFDRYGKNSIDCNEDSINEYKNNMINMKSKVCTIFQFIQCIIILFLLCLLLFSQIISLLFQQNVINNSIGYYYF